MVIIGAGQAGGRAALTLRSEGWDGEIVLCGEESFAPYERPPLSKEVLTGGRQLDDFTFAAAEALSEAGVQTRLASSVAAIDRPGKTVVLSGGDRIPYDKLLIATGRRPRPLPGSRAEGKDLLYLRTYDDALRIKERLVPDARVAIIGGGFIGLELAAAARGLGCRAVVIEAASRLLARGVPEWIADVLGERHRAEGVDIRLDTQVLAMERRANGTRLDLSRSEVVTADAVIVGIGAIPRTELAEAAGLAVDNGIVVDGTLASSDPDIFAAGDVCAFPHQLADNLLRLESWHNAESQGALAARNMLGAEAIYRDVPWFWSDQYDLTMQMAGDPLRGRTTVERSTAGGCITFHLDHGGRLVGVAGVGPLSIAKDIRVAQMLIDREAVPDQSILSDPDARLKQLLR